MVLGLWRVMSKSIVLVCGIPKSAQVLVMRSVSTNFAEKAEVRLAQQLFPPPMSIQQLYLVRHVMAR
jgi:hypothetical protein